jgi:hypothetical protein
MALSPTGLLQQKPIKVGGGLFGEDRPRWQLFQEQQRASADAEAARQQAAIQRGIEMENLGIQQGQLGLESGRFRLGQEQAMSPFQLRSAEAGAGLSELGLRREEYEFGEFQAGAGQRAAERQFAEAKTKSQLSFLPQMEAIRGGIMGRMAGQLGVNLPQQPSLLSIRNPSEYRPWMQSYQTPQFPR